MINLGERLLTIANMITEGETVADIGTDHGYLPIYLLKKEISPSVILTDISKASLAKARGNIEELNFAERAMFREGDGLEVISRGEVDVIVLAGIGGLLTIEILDWDLGKSHSFKKLILQPRNNCGALRKYLATHGFEIKELLVVPEGRRFCEIMKVCISDKYASKSANFESITDAEWEFPDELISSKTENGKLYLEKCLEQEKNIYGKITSGLGERIGKSTEKDLEFRNKRIVRITDLLSRTNELK